MSCPELLQALHWVEEALQCEHAFRNHPWICEQNPRPQADNSDCLLPVPVRTPPSAVSFIVLAPMAVQWPAVNKTSGVKKNKLDQLIVWKEPPISYGEICMCAFFITICLISFLTYSYDNPDFSIKWIIGKNPNNSTYAFP